MKQNNNIHLASTDTCTGCSACVSVCPIGSISMKEDREGFLQPHIETKTCIGCHKCEKTCPIITPIKIPTDFETQAYAAINKDEAVRMRSSSGGMFHALAKWTIEQGGVVFGARFNDQWEVVHDYTETIEGIEPFMRSKYVQSRICDTFKQAKQFLEAGRQVLFVGTPCQIGGLKAYLNKEYDNLLAVDFICHGVPSPGIWNKYLHQEFPSIRSISNINFRDKANGWSGLYLIRITTEGNQHIIMNDSNNDPFIYGFLHDYYLRRSCYQCHFKSVKRISDITIADAWRIENYMPDMTDGKGTSLCLIHSICGNDAFRGILPLMKTNGIEVNVPLKNNQRATTSVKRTKDRDLFYFLNKFITIAQSVKLIKRKSKLKTKIQRFFK